MFKLGLQQILIALAVIAPAFSFLVLAEDVGIEYLVEFEGVEDGKILSRLKDLSDTVGLRQSPPLSLLQLRRRLQRDEVTLLKALRAEGYYTSSVSSLVEVGAELTVVQFSIVMGPQYDFATATVELVDLPEDTSITVPTPDEFGLKVGGAALAQTVVNVEQMLLKALRDQGFPFARVLEREVVVDHASQSMEVTYRLVSGAFAHFGQLRISGLDKVREKVVVAEVPWQKQVPYNDGSLETLRKRLYDTGLFSVVRIEPADDLDQNQTLAIDLKLTERKHRTLWAGAEYYLDEGLGTRIGWEHRNIQGLGRRLLFELRVSETRLEARSEFSIRHFKRRDQTLRLSLQGGRYNPEAFETTRVRTTVTLERKLRKHVTGSLGVAMKVSKVEQLEDTDSFRLLSLPAQLSWNRANSTLDPTRGFKIVGRTEPFVDFISAETVFLKSDVAANHYLSLAGDGKLVFATRVMFGAIVGESKMNIPADDRFYAGGGGSIRGYPFQTVGPLDGDDPTGGRSVFESSAELRYRFAEHFGVVAFVDGGSAFESTFPDFKEDILFGAGLGLRYFSPIGPLRMDVAFPLDRRADVDESFQLYISIGQAF